MANRSRQTGPIPSNVVIPGKRLKEPLRFDHDTVLNQVRAAPDMAESIEECMRSILLVVDGVEEDLVATTEVAFDTEDAFTVAVDHFQALDGLPFCLVAAHQGS